MESYENKSVKDLELLCKQYGIHYYQSKRHLKKDEMIEEIKRYEGHKLPTATKEEDTLAKGFSEKKIELIKNAEAGTIIAFVDNYGKARTAKVDENNQSKSFIIATTEFGRTFKIPYKNVLWVRNEQNSRWPKGVYNMLKGITV